ncbi:uncharacterized protein LOC130295761 isoform X3 [Hyla sarda]|uniref:uncharacterized protein LOC130295761 isoform X3 n=1 Tax=Hyla sarda TaxID=327740 RepID=UPI0024C21C7E|nr:uncharacterized protein LOC130295761 isoform X3 [Hyla sarda]
MTGISYLEVLSASHAGAVTNYPRLQHHYMDQVNASPSLFKARAIVLHRHGKRNLEKMKKLMSICGIHVKQREKNRRSLVKNQRITEIVRPYCLLICRQLQAAPFRHYMVSPCFSQLEAVPSRDCEALVSTHASANFWLCHSATIWSPHAANTSTLCHSATIWSRMLMQPPCCVI